MRRIQSLLETHAEMEYLNSKAVTLATINKRNFGELGV